MFPIVSRSHLSNFKVTRAENRFASNLRLQGLSQLSNPSGLPCLKLTNLNTLNVQPDSDTRL